MHSMGRLVTNLPRVHFKFAGWYEHHCATMDLDSSGLVPTAAYELVPRSIPNPVLAP